MRFKLYLTAAALSLLINVGLSQEIQTIERKDFVFGLSIGGAFTTVQFPDVSENHQDLGIAFKIGYMVRPNIALLLGSDVAIYDYVGFGRDRKRDFGVLAPSVQYWLTKRIWLRAGIGLGGDNPVFWDIKNPDTDTLETKYYFGSGLVGAIGYEIYQSDKNFTIDLKARGMYRNVNLQEGKTSGFSYGILLGFNFY